jgi:hypothetical protein
MAVDLRSGALLDPHGGRADLEGRIVRMVDAGNFDDDPLRMVKAVRMAVRFGFSIDDATLAAIRDRAPRITDVAVERVAYELTVIFSAKSFRRAIALLHETSLDLPLFGRALDGQAFAADDVPLAAALALLVPDAEAFAKRWRLSGTLLRDVLMLQHLRDAHSLLDLYDAGEAVAGQLTPMLRALGREELIDLPDFEMRPLLTGDEIASLAAIAAGPRVGQLKRALLDEQLSGRITTREDAAAFITASA